jgi:two-component system nitrate/nitrite response regulator NarL
VNTTSVAFIDDHPMTIEGLVHVLASHTDYRLVATGRSGEDAIAIANEHKPDVIVLDLAIPGNAITTIATIVQRHPDVRVIAFTAAPGVEYAVNALEAGARGFVSKTCAVEEFITAVRAVTAGETYVSQNFATRVIAALRNSSVRRIASQALKLSAREDQIVRLLLHGKTNKEIALNLAISEKTVKHYMTILMQKLNARNRVEAVIAAQRLESDGSSEPPAPLTHRN